MLQFLQSVEQLVEWGAAYGRVTKNVSIAFGCHVGPVVAVEMHNSFARCELFDGSALFCVFVGAYGATYVAPEDVAPGRYAVGKWLAALDGEVGQATSRIDAAVGAYGAHRTGAGAPSASAAVAVIGRVASTVYRSRPQ